MTVRANHPSPPCRALLPGGFIMKVLKWPTAVSLALVVARIAVPVLAAIAAGQRWDVALLAALGVEAGAGAAVNRP